MKHALRRTHHLGKQRHARVKLQIIRIPKNLDKEASSERIAFDPSSLPHIADLIDYGEITVGVIEPVGCVATATDGSNCLDMLVRRDGAPLRELLIRLDLAIARAFVAEIFTDEVNARPR